MRLRRGYLFLGVVLGTGAAALPAMAVTEPSVEAVNVGVYSHYWSPMQTSVTGGTVKLSNKTTTAHGVEWVGGPVKPSCEEGPGQIPVGTTPAASGANWSGKCTFTKPGVYTFYCTVHGPEMTETITVTNPGEPTATTEAATLVGEHEATLKGTLNPEGKTTEYFFNWGTSASYGQKTSSQPAGAGTTGVPASAILSGLAPGTPYHFQLVAKNSSGEVPGADQVFTTASPPGPPAATTSGATSVTETDATLRGTVNPDGRPTKYFFEWGTTENYGLLTTEVPAGEDHTGHIASATLTGLSPGVVYHFRLVAKNTSLETVTGADQKFMTASPPPAPPVPPTPPPATTTPLTAPPPTITPILATPASISEEGPPLGSSVKLAASQHGPSVRGAVEVSPTGAGGRLEVDLLTNSASLAKAKPLSRVSVGRLLRSSLKVGALSFAVPLSAKAKSALRRKRRLALTVKIVLTPLHGAPVSTTRSVVLHA